MLSRWLLVSRPFPHNYSSYFNLSRTSSNCNSRSFSWVTAASLSNSRSNSVNYILRSTISHANELSFRGNNNTHTFKVVQKQEQQRQQVRFMGGRNVGHRYWNMPRPPTAKQRKAHRRKKRREYYETGMGKHSLPGSKRVQRQKDLSDMLDVAKLEASGKILPYDKDPELMKYNYGHAVIEDLMGNSAHLSSTPTPKIKNYVKYYPLQLQKLQQYQQQQQQHNEDQPPMNDSDLSLLVRAYRDHLRQDNSNTTNTTTTTINIAHILQTLTKTWKIPLSDLGEHTYTSIMMWANHPAEARLILNKMRASQLPLAYAYSILVHLHSRRGEYKEARQALDELLPIIQQQQQQQQQNTTDESEEQSGSPSPLPAYTSLIAACYKAIMKDFTTPRSIKSDAATVAWEAWKEMRIVGIKADVMAYGAIIRLFAARGQPERCINLIEEMAMLHRVLPTTLIYTAALHAVAKSHGTALRFEGGTHRKDLRRQRIAAHHGKLARQIVLMAEGAEVEQDDGFVSALISCAAAAGDSATAKAIYLAADIRRKDHLRTIGSKEHLKSLQPPPEYDMSHMMFDSNSNNSALLLGQNKGGSVLSSLEDDKNNLNMASAPGNLFLNGFDDETTDLPPQVNDKSRKYRSLLAAYAHSMEPKGIGDLWGGPKNKGFLCERTQRAIVTRQVPKYRDNSIPGMTGMEVAMGSMDWEDEPERDGKQLRLKKFTGLHQNFDAGSTMDDIDPELAAMFDQDEDDKINQKETTGMLEYSESDEYDSDYDDYKESKDGSELNSVEKDSKRTETLNQISHDTEGDEHQHTFLEENESTVMSTLLDEILTNDDNNDYGNFSPSLQVGREENELDEFEREMPVGLPKSRVNKLRTVFQASLAEPSMLELIPLLRENMPEDPDLHWLQKKNMQDAYFVMEKAEEEGLVDTKLLNNMLQVITNSNLIGRALSYHETQYKLRDLEPDSYSDRLIVEMLIRNKRISRALEFKDKVVEQKYGRFLDLFAYGSFVDYYGKQYQLGSALLMLKECIDIHGFPPNEKTLTRIRLMCRQRSLEEQVKLEELIGKDPLEWIRNGQKLKRDKSKKGRRHVIQIQNKALRKL
jgi:hypothetical protein